MTKTLVISLVSTLVLVGLLTNCKKPSTPPVSELIAKNWTVSKVEENGTTYYTRGGGGAANIRDYSKFRLNLTAPSGVNYADWDGIAVTGNYTLPSDTQLTLNNLNPAPTGTAPTAGALGTISYTINAIDESNLKITRLSTSVKTGGSINVYTLTNP